jgi:hypothetical protein
MEHEVVLKKLKNFPQNLRFGFGDSISHPPVHRFETAALDRCGFSIRVEEFLSPPSISSNEGSEKAI